MYIILVLLVLCILLTLLYLRQIYSYWSKQSVPCIKGVISGLGNMWPVISLKRNFFEFIQDIYETYSCHSMIGYYNMTTPAIIICDPHLVNTVLQTNFASFHKNKLAVDPVLDPIAHNATIFTDGYEWATSRKRLMQAFSSSRLKMFFNVTEEVDKKMEIFLEQRLGRNNRIEIELRDLFSRYTAEIVANAVFGIESSCFGFEERLSSFQEIGRKIFEPSFSSMLFQILIFFMPQLNKIFRARFLSKEADSYFRVTLREIMEIRRKEEVSRSDFFQHIIDLERAEGAILDENAVLGHAFSFYTEAYMVTSVALSYVGYQLARHQDVQDKVRQEINSVIFEYDGMITYEALKRMTYLYQVICESQRINPTEGAISKICTRTCTLKGSDGLSCCVDPGTEIIIPMQGLQTDPKYWTNPYVFDPDRFSPDRAKKMKKHTFLPFGEGPRMCVGSKMALLEMKACLSILLKKYRLTISPKMRIPLRKSPGLLLPIVVGGIWVYLERI